MATVMAGGVQAGVSYVTKKELERRVESNRQRRALLPIQLIQRVNICLWIPDYVLSSNSVSYFASNSFIRSRCMCFEE